MLCHSNKIQLIILISNWGFEGEGEGEGKGGSEYTTNDKITANRIFDLKSKIDCEKNFLFDIYW